MRVLVVTSIFLSGHGNFVAEQVRSIRSAKIDVDVLFFDPRQNRANYASNLPRIIRAIGSRRYDIIHTHHTYTMILVDIAKRLTRSTTPTVLTHHEPETLDSEGRTRTWHPTSQLRHSKRLKRFAARRADFVIFVSRQLATTLAIDRPQDVIPCGVDLGKFRPLDRMESRRRLGLPADRQMFFFPPHPKNRRKRFELDRQAYELVRAELPDVLIVTGGDIHADTMPLYYNAADVMVQTSYCEASPTVVKEALACELPVVSTDVGDTREMIEGVPHCWVCPEEPRELAKRILEANGHRAQGARDHLLRKGLGLEQVAQRVTQVYEQVLNGRPHGFKVAALDPK